MVEVYCFGVLRVDIGFMEVSGLGLTGLRGQSFKGCGGFRVA